MKIVTFRRGEELRLGIAHDGRVIDVADAASELGLDAPATPDTFYAQGLDALPSLREVAQGAAPALAGDGAAWLFAESELTLGPVVPAPQKILCVGLNYLRHAEESGMAPPKTPVLFSKFANSIAATGDDVPLPFEAKEYDYEAELVAVIGRRARRVSEADALSYVLGYANGNDVSARDLQMLTGQWLLGKTLDRFLPLGPYLVTADEIDDPQAMQVRCWMNGELRQDSDTSDMIFSVAQVVSYASRYMTLEPGDVISTGTPEGVILGRPVKTWLAPGDEVVVEIGPLGRLVNRMTEDRP